jgi:hypothetical protein
MGATTGKGLGLGALLDVWVSPLQKSYLKPHARAAGMI